MLLPDCFKENLYARARQIGDGGRENYIIAYAHMELWLLCKDLKNVDRFRMPQHLNNKIEEYLYWSIYLQYPVINGEIEDWLQILVRAKEIANAWNGKKIKVYLRGVLSGIVKKREANEKVLNDYLKRRGFIPPGNRWFDKFKKRLVGLSIQEQSKLLAAKHAKRRIKYPKGVIESHWDLF